MFRIPKQKYTAEFRPPAVNQVKSGETVGGGARDCGLVEEIVRNWVSRRKLANSTRRGP